MKQAVVILAVALIVALAGILVFLNQANHAREEAAAATLAARQAGIEAAAQAQAEQETLARAKAAQEANAQAEEAARMAEAAAAKAEAERQARLEALNAQLAAEAKAREAAEKEAAAIAARMQKLEDEMEKTRQQAEALAARQAGLSGPVSQEHQQIIDAIEKRKAELAKLKAEQQEMEKQRELHITKQIELEESIAQSGGAITIPGYRVWSPNFRPTAQRPRQAIED